MERKFKLRLYQSLFIILGIAIIIFTYFQTSNQNENQIISESQRKKINEQSKNLSSGNTFYNVRYSGLDLEGNRYILISEEAVSDDQNSEIVKTKKMVVRFYFKDGKILKVSSNRGIYNNKTLDMKFMQDVIAEYEDSKLFSEEAEFLNSLNSLTVSKNVKLIDKKGTLYADKLKFDVKNKILNISSKKNKMVKSKIVYK